MPVKLKPRQVVTLLKALHWRRQRKRQCRANVERFIASRLPPVLIYQMAKVGSSTITSALQRVKGLNAVQLHYMNPTNISELRTKLSQKGLARWQMDIDIIGETFFKRFIQPGHPAGIITLAREPIGRNISFYFETLDVLWETANAHDKLTLPQLLNGFLDKFDHTRALCWFDSEFAPVLGVDIYDYAFPRTAGYQRLATGRYDILILRTDLPDTAKAQRIAEFLGLEDFTLVRENVAAQKPYAAVYQKFLAAIELPASYVDEMLAAKYTRHFFTDEEIAALRTKWLRPANVKNLRE